MSQKSVSETLKDLLPTPTQQIRLDDFISTHVRAAKESLNPEKYPLPNSFSKEQFEEQVHCYERAVGDLQTISILLARWANADQSILLEKILSRLAEGDKPGNGLTIYLGLAWHPLQLLIYAAGISALSAKKFDLLPIIFLTHIRQQHRTGVPDTPLIIPLTDGITETDSGFKLLPGHERHLVPRSEYVFKYLQPEIEDLLFLGRSYESYFDEFEILWALVYADLVNNGWGPPGRFAWKQRHSQPSPLDQMIKEAEKEKENWPPIRARLFSGSLARFLEVANSYRDLIVKHPLR